MNYVIQRDEERVVAIDLTHAKSAEEFFGGKIPPEFVLFGQQDDLLSDFPGEGKIISALCDFDDKTSSDFSTIIEILMERSFIAGMKFQKMKKQKKKKPL